MLQAGQGKGAEVLVEGWTIVEEVLRAGRTLSVVMADTKAWEILNHSPWWSRAHNGETYHVPPSLLSVMADTQTPQGIVALTGRKIASLEDCLGGDDGVILWLNGLQDPGNVGTIIRTALAFGVKRIVVTKGTASPWLPKVTRAASGATFRAVIAEVEPGVGWLNQAKQRGFEVFIAHPRGGIPPEAVKAKRLVVGIGQEAKGFTAEECASGTMVTIPQNSGEMESLNAGMAAGILLYGLTKNLKIL